MEMPGVGTPANREMSTSSSHRPVVTCAIREDNMANVKIFMRCSSFSIFRLPAFSVLVFFSFPFLNVTFVTPIQSGLAY
jgi:hypothetical protein